MNFDAPYCLLLAGPALYLVWRWRGSSAPTTALRLALVVLVVLALAGPRWQRGTQGRDLVVVVDRSRSMPAGAEATALERIRLAEAAREHGDRVGIVTFGADARIEALPDEGSRDRGFTLAIDADGSDLAGALDTALELVDAERAGAFLVVSDGEVRGASPLSAARRARARGIPVHVLPQARPPVSDISVERLDLPSEVAAGEPFQFGAWLFADAPGQVAYVLSRSGTVLSRATRELRSGWNRILFRDVLDEAGIGVYQLRIEGAGDRVPENDFGLGAVLVRGTKPILIVNHDGRPDTLSETWREAGLDVVVATPEAAPLDALGLAGFRAVVLENVAARRLEPALPALAEFVTERGGGLLMTGGKASFGIGGYQGSRLDPLLPVSMMLENEDRKVGVAIAFVLDRSGSMGASVAGGRTKMDLANLGTMAAIELLSGLDSAAVIAVDSSPHTIVEPRLVTSHSAFRERVLSIESAGGGIFVRTGLDAAVEVLRDTDHANRHIVLFADAADAEEPDGVLELARELHATRNTSLSVIALGTEFDADARFLTETALAGGGSIYFATNPEELPALFARDTLTVARSAFIEEPTGAVPSPAIFGLGELALDDFPVVDGYNLNYSRADTDIGVRTTDEHAAPLFAFHHEGLGRVAALGCEVGGTFGAGFVAWHDAGRFLVTLGRWLAGQEEPAAFYPTVTRNGREAVIGVEVDRATAPDTSGLVARLRSPRGDWTEHRLERVTQDRFEARVLLEREGIHLGTLSVPGEDGETVVTLPPIALPYSPEYERPFSAQSGERSLQEVARAGGGEVDPLGDAVWPAARARSATERISRPLALTVLLLALLELAGRRLGLWAALADRRERPRPAAESHTPRAPRPPAAAAPVSKTASVADAISSAKSKAARRTSR
ncbi:MAG: VWA domain-containing protein [Planctomycetota bacterium]